jgi:predicted RNase H-like nuclease (RuvC/YqgF family)
MSDTTTTPTEEQVINQTSTVDTTTETKPNDKEFNFRALEAKAKALEKENAKLKAEQQNKLEKELAEQGKLKELAELKTQEAENLKKELETMRFESQLQNEITKSGVNPKYLEFLQDKVKKSVKVNETGEIENLTETLSKFKTEYSEWFNPQPIASFGSDRTTGTTSGMSSSEIMQIMDSGDADLIAKNADKIQQAFKL